MSEYRIIPVFHGFAVRNAQGETVCPVQRRKEAAEALVATLIARHARQKRACLRCGHAFDSGGIHDRMCAPCGNAATANDGSYAVSRQMGGKASRSAMRARA